MKKLLLFSLLLLVIRSSGQESPRGTIGMQLDQDFLVAPIGKNEDRNYTQGTTFTYMANGQEEENVLFLPNKLLDNLVSNVLGGNIRGEALPAAFTIGVSAFTPKDIRTYYPEYGDRPYSNLVFFSTSTSRINDRGRMYTWDFTYGLLGTNVGKEFQNLTHRMRYLSGRGVPLGWDTQIGKGGKPVFMVRNTFLSPFVRQDRTKKQYEEKEKLKLISMCGKHFTCFNKFGVDGYYGTELAAGYYTYLGGKIGGRLGLIDKYNYAITSSSATDPASKADNLDKPAKYKSREFFLYGNFAARLFGRNVLLTGSRRFSSGYSIDPDLMSTFVSDFELGLCRATTISIFNPGNIAEGTRNGNSFRLSASIKIRSTEITHPVFRRSHYWGCLTLWVPVGG